MTPVDSAYDVTTKTRCEIGRAVSTSNAHGYRDEPISRGRFAFKAPAPEHAADASRCEISVAMSGFHSSLPIETPYNAVCFADAAVTPGACEPALRTYPHASGVVHFKLGPEPGRAAATMTMLRREDRFGEYHLVATCLRQQPGGQPARVVTMAQSWTWIGQQKCRLELRDPHRPEPLGTACIGPRGPIPCAEVAGSED